MWKVFLFSKLGLGPSRLLAAKLSLMLLFSFSCSEQIEKEKKEKPSGFLKCDNPLVKAKLMTRPQSKTEYFGYYASHAGNDEMRDHANTYWVYNFGEMEVVASFGQFVVWSIIDEFFNDSGHLRKDYQKHWNSLWAEVKRRKFEKNITMIYTMDEPGVWPSRNKFKITHKQVIEELTLLHRYIKSTQTQIPLGIALSLWEVAYTSEPFPEKTDWLGYDCYGPHETCFTGIYVEDLPSQEDITCTLLSRMNNDQKLFWIPQAFHSFEFPANEELGLILANKDDPEKKYERLDAKIKPRLSGKQKKIAFDLLTQDRKKIFIPPINTPNEIREKILIERVQKYLSFLRKNSISVVAVFPFLWSWGQGHPDVNSFKINNVELVSVRGLDLMPNLLTEFRNLARAIPLARPKND